MGFQNAQRWFPFLAQLLFNPLFRYYGRLLCDLDCEATKLQRPTIRDLTMAAIVGSEAFYCLRNFTLFASFFSANMINPEFK